MSEWLCVRVGSGSARDSNEIGERRGPCLVVSLVQQHSAAPNCASS